MLYPIGIQSFEDLRRKGFVYVDKSGFVYQMAARFLAIILTTVLGAVSVYAQTAEDSFGEFRERMLTDYSGFRGSVLDGYADYLDTVWKEYQTFAGKSRDPLPKPKVVPDVNSEPAASPAEVSAPKPMPGKPIPAQPVQPGQEQPVPPIPAEPSVSFPFYGMALKAPRLHTADISELTSGAAAAAWRWYEGNGTRQAALMLKDHARNLGLGDWFAYEMVRECVNHQCQGSSSAARVSLQHYLLANMGYDVREADYHHEACLLVAIDQQIYARSYLCIDGNTYYVFMADGSQPDGQGYLKTSSLPSGASLGKSLDMRVKNLSGISSGNRHHCELTVGSTIVEADVDVMLMEMLRHYPQMDIAEYAMSEVSPSLRETVVEQLRSLVSGLSKAESADKLLHFVQSAFAYATDDDQHGYEKPYFVEENFYYPKNDCEDRAIFYAFLVRNLLGLDVHLVQFPGHECTAVNFGDADVRGTYYVSNGCRYFICDPTYIGANIGQCMPDFQGIAPTKVEAW